MLYQNSNLPRLRFFVYCIYIIMQHSDLNDMKIPKTKRVIPKGFELGTIESGAPNENIVQNHLDSIVKRIL